MFYYFLYFNFNAKIKIIVQDAKFNPVTISNNKSEITNRAYKKVIQLQNVQMIYELIFALAIFFVKSLIVGIYPTVAIIPVLA